MHESQLTL